LEKRKYVRIALRSGEIFPLKKIRDTLHFAKKDESRHLQLADLCSFVTRGHLTKHPHNPRFFEPLKGNFILSPEEALAQQL
jgi:hypothetical protein